MESFVKALYTSVIITIGVCSCNTITDPVPEDPLVSSKVMQLCCAWGRGASMEVQTYQIGISLGVKLK